MNWKKIWVFRAIYFLAVLLVCHLVLKDTWRIALGWSILSIATMVALDLMFGRYKWKDEKDS